jgi:RES domain-containing protein
VSSVTVWRINAATYADRVFTGEGSLRIHGRWHPKGVPVIYTSDSRALAALEILANANGAPSLHDRLWVIASAEIPASLIHAPSRFPDNWRVNPPSDTTRSFGKTWFNSAQSPALRVPSAVIPGEFNYLLNPLHPDFAKIKLHPPQPFAFDARF